TASGYNGEKAESEGSDNEKLKHKLKSTVKQIHKTMSEEQDTHDWFMLEEEHPDEIKQELNRIKQPLSAFIADNALKEQARALFKSILVIVTIILFMSQKIQKLVLKLQRKQMIC